VRSFFQWIQSLFNSTPAVRQSTKLTPSSQATTTDPPTVIYICVQTAGPLRQSEILSDVVQRRQSFRSLGTDKRELEEIRHPHAVVVTQDCDLEQDFKARLEEPSTPNVADKVIPNILLLEAISVTELLAGLAGKDIRKRVRQNKDERYHVFQRVEAADDAEGVGLTALGADFKRCFTVPTDELYAQLRSNAKRRTYLSSPYMEHFAKRFADFQSRVALPKAHEID
jgi:hypothetical protein